jgi:uncharacterized RDD family membrane protein YckC
MSTQRPAFGKKKASTVPQRTMRPARSQSLSPEAQAFLEREQRSDGPSSSYSQPAFSVSASAGAVAAGKPVWLRRVFARLFDEFLIWTLILAMFHKDIGQQITAYLGGPSGSPEETAAGAALFLYALLWGVCESIYNIAMEASPVQATLGKMIVGVVVTDRDGGKPTFGKVLMRNTLGRFVANIVPFYAGYVMGLFNKERRCLHDMMAGTVVRKRGPVAAGAGYGEVFA